MKDEDFLNQKAKDMTIKELEDAIKIKKKRGEEVNNQTFLIQERD